MITYLINLIEQTLIPLGGWGVFGALFIQEIIVFIPSALVMLGAGFILLSGNPLSFQFLSTLVLEITLPAALGATLGSLMIYGLLYFYGKGAVERFGKYAGLSWGDIEKVNKRLSGTYADELVIFALRAIPIVPNSAVSALCGLIRMRLAKYLALSFFGIAVRAAILAVVGSQVGELYRQYAARLDRFEDYILIVGFLALVVITLWLYLRRQARAAAPDGSSEENDKMP